MLEKQSSVKEKLKMETLYEKALAVKIAQSIQILERLKSGKDRDERSYEIQLLLRNASEVEGIDWLWKFGQSWLLRQWDSAAEAVQYFERVVSGDVTLNPSDQDVLDLRALITHEIEEHIAELQYLFSWKGDEDTMVHTAGENVIVKKHFTDGTDPREIDRF